jgi:hypothetical protein
VTGRGVAFVGGLAIVTWSEIKFCHDMPWPPRLVGTGIVYGMIDVIGILSDPLANVFAIGFTVVLLMQVLSDNWSGPLQPNCNHSGTQQPATLTELSGGLPQGNTGGQVV